MAYLYRHDRKIYYVIEPAVNQANAETIVLIHTNVTDHTLYDRIVPYLNQEYQIVRYDLPGFGLSQSEVQDVSLYQYAKDLKSLVQELNVIRLFIIAIGFGGLIALEYSRLCEDKVKKMALMTMPCFPEETLDVVQNHRKKISSDFTVIPADNIMKKTTLLAENDPEYKRLHHIMTKQPISIYVEIMNRTVTADTIKLLNKNKIPTLILAGDCEIIFPQNLLAAKCAYLPSHQYTVVSNSSSFLMIDQPEITAKLAIEFFKAETEHGRYKDDTATSISNDIRLYTQGYYQNNIQPAKQSKQNQIQVDILYSFRVLINGVPVIKGMNQRYAKNMLIYLLFHPTTTREEMCENIWPETPLHTAKKNLRVYLSHLKKTLNPYSTEQSVLIVDRKHIYLNGAVTSDALVLISDLHTASLLKDENQKYTRLKHITAQFISPNYLTAIYDPWFLSLRSKVEEDFIHSIIWMSEWLTQDGKARDGLHHLIRSLPIFEDNIKLYDAIIEIYKKIPNEEQLQYWKEEKMRIWG